MKFQMAKKFLVVMLCLSQTVMGAERETLKDIFKFPDIANAIQRGSVFVHGDPTLDTLIPVRLLGAVTKSGVYYVPPDTDLMTLLTLAGGITDKAEIDNIVFRRPTKTGHDIIKVNLEQLMNDPHLESPRLSRNDIILIPAERTMVSDNTLRVASLVTAAATVFTSILLAVRH